MKHGKIRRAAGMLAALLSAVLTACANPQPTGLPQATPTAEAGPAASATPGRKIAWPTGIDFKTLEGKEIVLYTDALSTDSQQQDFKMWQDFTQRYGVSFKAVAPGEGDDGWMTKLGLLVATNAGPTVLEGGAFSMPRAARYALLTPIDPWLNPQDDTFMPHIMEEFSWLGQRYCMQYWSDLSFRSVAYNLTAFEETGLETPLESWQNGDWTWDRLMENSQKFFATDEAGAQISYGFTFDVQDMAAAIALNGAQLYTQVGQAYALHIQDDRVREMLSLLRDGRSRGDMMFRTSTPEQVADGTVKMCGQNWRDVEALHGLAEAQKNGNRIQAVPMPVGPSMDTKGAVCTTAHFYMLGANSGAPEAGYAWVWYCGGALDPLVPGQDSGQQPEHVRAMDAVWREIRQNARFVTAANVEGIPGLADGFEQMCRKLMYGQEMSSVLEETGKAMEAALAHAAAIRPVEPDRIAAPRLPEDALAAARTGSGDVLVALTREQDKIILHMPNPEGAWVEADALILRGEDIFFPGLVHYRVAITYEITQGYDAIGLGSVQIGLKNGTDQEVTGYTWWDGFEKAGTLELSLTHLDQAGQDDVYFFIHLMSDGGPVTMEITKLEITAQATA
nr:extracellular solute-binding protein [bacterium]